MTSTITPPSNTPVRPEAGVVEPFPVRKLWITLGVIVVIAVVTAALIISGNSTEEKQTISDLAQCKVVPDAVAAAITARAELGEEILRSFVATRVSDTEERGWFVSAERIRPGRPRGAKGQILTWHTADPLRPLDDYTSVDVSAREHSSWPRSELDVQQPAALRGRGCVAKVRDERWQRHLFGAGAR